LNEDRCLLVKDLSVCDVPQISVAAFRTFPFSQKYLVRHSLVRQCLDLLLIQKELLLRFNARELRYSSVSYAQLCSFPPTTFAYSGKPPCFQ
jgi:hypothetical protein